MPMPSKPKRKHPDLLSFACPAEFVFAAEGEGEGAPASGEKKLPRVKLTAYDGKPMRVFAWLDPVVIDLEGLQFAQALPLRFAHDARLLVGHTEAVEVKGTKLTAAGVVSFENQVAADIVSSARNGFPWQASVGVQPLEVEFLPAGTSTTVNGMKVQGPIDVIRKGRLKEISFVDLGASGGTKVSVAAASATKDSTMDEDEKDNAPSTTPAPVEAGATASTTATAPADAAVASIRAAAAAETERIAAIQEVAAGHPTIAAQAIREGWTRDKAELAVLRASRPAAPAVNGGGAHAPVDAAVLEAAVCAAAKLPGLDKRFAAPVLEAADKRFRGRIGLQELILEAAQAAGYHGRSLRGDLKGGLQAAFSTLALPGILSNAANKFLLQGFTAVEQAWRAIAATRPVSDFKTVTSYRLTGGFQFEKVGPTGELKHATAGEESFTNKAETYGKMFAITRQDIINDDLGALTQVPQRIGRGAALELNRVFWALFLNNSSFFTTARGNYFEGAATNLQLSSLATALQMFRDQTDPDGKPLALAPAVLLVPTALEVTAASLMNSTEVRDTTASTKYPVSNPFAGMFRPVVSAYLSNATLTGNSSTAWYLLANPAELATIEVAFLNGVEEPTVEDAQADFNVLGIQMRGFFDFGVALQEYRAGVKSKGAA